MITLARATGRGRGRGRGKAGSVFGLSPGIVQLQEVQLIERLAQLDFDFDFVFDQLLGTWPS